jgi:hypothetical protein
MQFGGTLPVVITHTRHADPRCGAVHIAKYDIKDSFYHMFLEFLTTWTTLWPHAPEKLLTSKPT